MRKAQGALEYLIIIAAVLAIAAIVVLFLTGAFTGASGGGDLASCRLAASTCKNNLASGVYASNASCVNSCIASCDDSRGYDVVTQTQLVSASTCATTGGAATGCVACVAGRTTDIKR
jgi:uncharacterized protein (UPF0333 family)